MEIRILKITVVQREEEERVEEEEEMVEEEEGVAVHLVLELIVVLAV